tara:strand:- start:29 stop:685 length:657 start_codon:yes stop_codon:yes gene_type:complete
MGILDNDTVIVDAILTKLGRDKLRQGQPLGITQYAFGDTGVDYTLYNVNHPSGSDSYGSAITSLPMLEAVPDDNVFMRSKLYGTGQRGIQNFAWISVVSPQTIQRAGSGNSQAITISPLVFSAGEQVEGKTFKFTVLDMRGLTVETPTLDVGNGFTAADVDKRNYVGESLTLNATSLQISRDITRTINVELEAGGAAPATVSVTVKQNSDASLSATTS